METEDWLSRWENSQTGWHQTGGSSALRKFWPGVLPGSRVLVPLCGKSPDLLWLAQQGCNVTGVELSEIAAQAFFEESGIRFELSQTNGFSYFRGLEQNVSIACGDYFSFSDQRFDALYDRAALVALPPNLRPLYIQHTKSLLKADARQLLLTLEYDKSKSLGPPFSVLPDEVKSYWPGLRRVGDRADTNNSLPKFRDAGISEVVEAVWVTV
jgi:thiopurine S-methyltransferase